MTRPKWSSLIESSRLGVGYRNFARRWKSFQELSNVFLANLTQIFFRSLKMLGLITYRHDS